jgi:hypothetical protein
MRRTLLLFALAAALAAVSTGCTDPRACQTDDDCFQGQTCTDQTCVGEISTDDTGSTGRDTDSSTTDPDTGPSTTDSENVGDTNAEETGSPPDDSGSPPDDTGDDGGRDGSPRKICSGTGSQGACTRDFQTECRTHGTHQYDVKLGCLRDDQIEGPKEMTDTVDHCFCGDTEQRRDDVKLILKTGNFTDDCTWEDGKVQVDTTIDVNGCNREEFDELYIEDGSSKCETSPMPNQYGWMWCDYHPEQTKIVVHWRPQTSQQPSREFSLVSSRDIAFTYSLQATGKSVQ